MRILRTWGLRISVFLIAAAHVARYSLARARGERGLRGVRVIVVRNGKVLLVSHWFAPWAWTLPGGGVRPGESHAEAAAREVREETGLRIKSIEGEVGSYTGPMGEGDRAYVLCTNDFEGSLSLRPNLEIMSRSWFDLEHLPDELSPANRKRIESYKRGVRGERGAW